MIANFQIEDCFFQQAAAAQQRKWEKLIKHASLFYAFCFRENFAIPPEQNSVSMQCFLVFQIVE